MHALAIRIRAILRQLEGAFAPFDAQIEAADAAQHAGDGAVGDDAADVFFGLEARKHRVHGGAQSPLIRHFDRRGGDVNGRVVPGGHGVAGGIPARRDVAVRAAEDDRGRRAGGERLAVRVRSREMAGEKSPSEFERGDYLPIQYRGNLLNHWRTEGLREPDTGFDWVRVDQYAFLINPTSGFIRDIVELED